MSYDKNNCSRIHYYRHNEQGENGDEEGRKESGGGGEDVDIEGNGLEEDSSSSSDSGDGEKAPTKRGRGMTTRKGGRTRVGAE